MQSATAFQTISLQETLRDGTIIIYYRDGSISEVYPNGLICTRRPNHNFLSMNMWTAPSLYTDPELFPVSDPQFKCTS